MVVGAVLGFSIWIPVSMGEAWFPLGCLLFPQSRGQASVCVQDNYVSLALCQVSSVQPPAYTLCPHPPEHTAGVAYTLPLGEGTREVR